MISPRSRTDSLDASTGGPAVLRAVLRSSVDDSSCPITALSPRGRGVRADAKRSFGTPRFSDPVPIVDHPCNKRIDEQRECLRRLAAALVVEVVTRVRRAPIVKHPLEAALGEMRRRHVLRHVGQAEPAECRIGVRVRVPPSAS